MLPLLKEVDRAIQSCSIVNLFVEEQCLNNSDHGKCPQIFISAEPAEHDLNLLKNWLPLLSSPRFLFLYTTSYFCSARCSRTWRTLHEILIHATSVHKEEKLKFKKSASSFCISEVFRISPYCSMFVALRLSSLSYIR